MIIIVRELYFFAGHVNIFETVKFVFSNNLKKKKKMFFRSCWKTRKSV